MRCAALWLVVLMSCSGVLVGGERPASLDEAASAEPPGWTPGVVPSLPSVATCGAAPSGRAYLGLGGEHLESSRHDRAAFVDLHRPFRGSLRSGNDWSIVGDIAGAVGAEGFRSEASRDPATGGAFGVVPERWYEESTVGPFAVYVTFTLAFRACKAAIANPTYRTKPGWYEHAAHAPTPDRAAQFCTKAQLNAWKRDPTRDEVQACVDLALDLDDEPDVATRWAYVCASVVSSMNWLSY